MTRFFSAHFTHKGYLGYHSFPEARQNSYRFGRESPHLIVKTIKGMFDRPTPGVAVPNLLDINAIFINVGDISVDNINSLNRVPFSICNGNIGCFFLNKDFFR